MRRMTSLLLVTLLACVTHCAHKASGGAASLFDETVQEDKAQVAVKLTWEAKGPRKLELVLKMQVIGPQESNKLVAETYIRHFNVEDGNTRWDGFIPPRDPQTVRLLLSIPEGQQEATATVNLSRSHDSFSLLKKELTFVVDGSGVVSLQ
jgi:hypothetical protein